MGAFLHYAAARKGNTDRRNGKAPHGGASFPGMVGARMGQGPRMGRATKRTDHCHASAPWAASLPQAGSTLGHQRSPCKAACLFPVRYTSRRLAALLGRTQGLDGPIPHHGPVRGLRAVSEGPTESPPFAHAHFPPFVNPPGPTTKSPKTCENSPVSYGSQR